MNKIRELLEQLVYDQKSVDILSEKDEESIDNIIKEIYHFSDCLLARKLFKA
jgi:hypothetical protein